MKPPTPPTPSRVRRDDLRRVRPLYRAAGRRRHRLRAGGGGAAAHARRAAEPARALRLRRRERRGTARLGARGLRRRDHRRRAARRRATPRVSFVAARGHDGDADRRACRRRAFRGDREPSLLSARLSQGGRAHADRHRPGVLHLHGNRAVAQHAARARRARRADDDRQRPAVRSLVPALPAGALGAPPERVVVTGNLKNDAPADAAGAANLWRRLLGMPRDQRVWIAGSTHRGEEEAVLTAHAAASGAHPGLALVLAPRHPERVDEVIALINARRFRTVRRSALPGGRTPGAVIVVDTVGELAQMYAVELADGVDDD